MRRCIPRHRICNFKEHWIIHCFMTKGITGGHCTDYSSILRHRDTVRLFSCAYIRKGSNLAVCCEWAVKGRPRNTVGLAKFPRCACREQLYLTMPSDFARLSYVNSAQNIQSVCEKLRFRRDMRDGALICKVKTLDHDRQD